MPASRAAAPDDPHHNFRPAKPSRFCLHLTWQLLRYILRQRQVLRVEIASEDIARLKALKDERVILTPNHPTNTDPALLLELSRRAQMPFYYLSCREAFDGWRGAWGVLIQRLGAYSVVRGTIDRESFRYTRELLAKPRAKLVIFPEGEVYSQNDSLLPFQVGAIQLALWGAEEARKTEPGARVLLLPIALRYRFAEDVRAELDHKLASLEKKLEIESARDLELTNLHARMRRVATKVLAQVETEYSLEPQPGDDLTPRFLAAKEAALERAAGLLDEKMPRGTVPERMRVLLHRAESELHELNEHLEENEDENIGRMDRVLRAWRDLERLANWVAIYDGYASQKLSAERLAEVIFRLENDVMGKATHAGARIATVRVGEPLELPAEIARRELPSWTAKLEESVRALL
jgi:1-acyl-sn-glycerol-3-phosphate acyltransferase